MASRFRCGWIVRAGAVPLVATLSLATLSLAALGLATLGLGATMANALRAIDFGEVVEVIPADGATIPTNARAFVVTEGPNARFTPTLCDDVAPSSDECAGTVLETLDFECVGSSPCVHAVRLGFLEPDSRVHVQVRDHASNQVFDLVFDIREDNDTDVPSAPVITRESLVLSRSGDQPIATTSLEVGYDDNDVTAIAIYRSLDGGLPSQLHVFPAPDGLDAALDLRLPRVGGPFCFRATAIDIAAYESNFSDEVCLDDGTFLGCAQTSPSFSLLSLMLLLFLRIRRIARGCRRHD